MQFSKNAPGRGFGSQPRNFSGPKRSFGSQKNNFGSQGRSFGGRKNFSKSRGRGEKIDISKFISKAIEVEEIPTAISQKTFSDFNLCDEIKSNLKYKKYITPTPIQDQAIDHVITGRDLIGLANTGTGKTAVFLLPLIDKVFKDKNQRVLIITPTRELAMQIESEFRQFAWNMKIFSALCVGGMPIYKQIKNLQINPGFVIGTPGRLQDLEKQNRIKFSSFQNIVIDEMDRMFDMGFIDPITEILKKMPEERQSLFFSATMPPKIRDLSVKFLKNPITVEVKTGLTAKNVDQDVVRVINKEGKFNQLHDLLLNPEFQKVLVFAETKREVEKLAINLSNGGFKAESIHGDKRQGQRQRSLNLFKDNSVNILVATDVAARGLDIKDITHVINYTVPQTFDDYIHRIGRTGRNNAKGKALTFVETRF